MHKECKAWQVFECIFMLYNAMRLITYHSVLRLAPSVSPRESQSKSKHDAKSGTLKNVLALYEQPRASSENRCKKWQFNPHSSSSFQHLLLYRTMVESTCVGTRVNQRWRIVRAKIVDDGNESWALRRSSQELKTERNANIAEYFSIKYLNQSILFPIILVLINIFSTASIHVWVTNSFFVSTIL